MQELTDEQIEEIFSAWLRRFKNRLNLKNIKFHGESVSADIVTLETSYDRIRR